MVHLGWIIDNAVNMLCISSIIKIVAEIKLVDLWLGVTGVQVQGFCLPVCRW